MIVRELLIESEWRKKEDRSNENIAGSGLIILIFGSLIRRASSQKVRNIPRELSGQAARVEIVGLIISVPPSPISYVALLGEIALRPVTHGQEDQPD